MTWYAKPSGGYRYNSTEGTENIREIRQTLVSEYGWTLEAVTAAVVNSTYEGGLNPWRWQGDTYGSAGCGIWGFTPSSRYLTTEGAEYMNRSTTEVTPNASPIVGYYQTKITGSASWGWVSSGWRSYWDKSQYPAEWREWQRLATVYGNGTSISFNRFKQVTNYRDAIEIFYCCFEGSAVNTMIRRANGDNVDPIWDIVSDGQPPQPWGDDDFFLIPILFLTKIFR